MRFRVAVDAGTGEVYLPVEERGRQLLEEPLLNKGSAFTREERESLGLEGLLPARTSTMEQHLERVRTQLENKPTAWRSTSTWPSLHDRNETLFHRFILENLEEVCPSSTPRRWPRPAGTGAGSSARLRGIYSPPTTGARSPGCCAAAASARRP